jgi:hypothetical protein
MLVRFPRLSRFVTKVVEIMGAGCASALAAIVLGNSHEAKQPPSPPPVVRLAPADEQMIKHVREESVALAEQLRSASEARAAGAVTAIAIPPAPKPGKPAAAAPVRREQKANRPPSDSRPRPAETTPAQSGLAPAAPEPARVAVSAPVATEAREARTIAAGAAIAGEPQAVPTQVPSRLWPAAASSVRDAPRPPAAVGGEYIWGSM